MTELIPFHFEDQQLRVIDRDKSPWFVAADVAEILGYSESAAMVRSLDEDEAILHTVQGRSQNRQMTIISESGLYNAIFRSRREEAKAFRRWVTGTVLPQIRATGAFGAASRALPGPLTGLPDLLATRKAVTLRHVASGLSMSEDPDSLAALAHHMRLQGWVKAWVRREDVR